MDGGEFLSTSHAPETLHRAFTPSERKVRVLDAVVEPPSRLLCFERAHFSERSSIRREAIGDYFFSFTAPPHRFPEEFQCCLLVSTFGNDCFQHFALMIDGPPKTKPLTIHLHENLVRVPLPFGVCSQLLSTLSSDLSSKHRAKPVPPISDSFVPHVDASLVQQVTDIPKRERETDVQHYRKTDDIGTGFEVFERGRSGHGQKLCNTPARLNTSSSDKTGLTIGAECHPTRPSNQRPAYQMLGPEPYRRDAIPPSHRDGKHSRQRRSGIGLRDAQTLRRSAGLTRFPLFRSADLRQNSARKKPCS